MARELESIIRSKLLKKVPKQMGMKLVLPAVVLSALVQGCVSAGYGGLEGNMIATDQMQAQREANRTIDVFKTAPAGYKSLGVMKTNRCHRILTAEPPSVAAITDDLKRIAYAQGADAISDVKTEKIGGLGSNCWYVLQGSAELWRK